MKRGFSLIEAVVYIAMLSAVLVLFAGIVLAVSGSYAKHAVLRSMDVAGITAMERMTREIRGASSVDAAGSTLGVTPGVLSLNRALPAGGSSKISFQVTGQNIQVKVDNADQGTLLPPEVTVSSLIFRQIDSGKSQAVKIEMSLAGSIGNATSSGSYYSTVILRGSYK